MNLGRSVLINAYSFHNAGDAAIMLATADLARDLGAESVTISSRYDDRDEYARFGINLVQEFVTFPARGSSGSLARLARFVASSVAALVVIASDTLNKRLGRLLLETVLPRAARSLAQFDSVIIAGGGYMYSSRRAINLSLVHSLLTIRLAQVALTTTLMMPQSVGPVRRRLDSRLIDWALRHTVVAIRESESILASTHEPRAALRAELVPDVAFYLPPSENAPKLRGQVRIVVMDWKWSASVSDSMWSRYLDTLASLADSLVVQGYSVSLGGHSAIPEHNQDDIAIARELAARCAQQVIVDPDCDVEHLLAVYAESTLVIGTRLHSCIMAISQGTPALAIGYQEKTLGVMRGAGFGDYVFRVDELVHEELVHSSTAAIESDRAVWRSASARLRAQIRDSYRAQLASGELESVR